jgi:uncharacterized membrane protein YidH (DUF202 family)
MNNNDNLTSDRMIANEIRLILDEKRTSISVLSTGIFILLAQITIQGVLIATSKFYKIIDVLHIVIPFYIINIVLAFLSFYLIIHSLLRIRHYNRLILRLKKKHSILADFSDL